MYHGLHDKILQFLFILSAQAFWSSSMIFSFMYSLITVHVPDSRVVDCGVVTVVDVSVAAGGVVVVSAEWIKIYMYMYINNDK